MELKTQKYLIDIRISIRSIYEYLGEKRDFTAYQNNKQLRRAVERELEIIGEASSRLLRLNPEIKIDDARKIVDLRNWVIHGYDKVDDIIVWGVISNYLPRLALQIDSLIAK